MLDSWNSGDVEAIVSLYDDNAVLVTPGGIRLSGKTEIEEYIRTILAKESPTDISLASRSEMQSGDLMSDTGSFSYVPKQGGRTLGQYMIVWKRFGKRFLIVQEMYYERDPVN